MKGLSLKVFNHLLIRVNLIITKKKKLVVIRNNCGEDACIIIYKGGQIPLI